MQARTIRHWAQSWAQSPRRFLTADFLVLQADPYAIPFFGTILRHKGEPLLTRKPLRFWKLTITRIGRAKHPRVANHDFRFRIIMNLDCRRSAAAMNKKSLDYECPTCGARPGASCAISDGSPRSKFHPARAAMAGKKSVCELRDRNNSAPPGPERD